MVSRKKPPLRGQKKYAVRNLLKRQQTLSNSVKSYDHDLPVWSSIVVLIDPSGEVAKVGGNDNLKS